MLLLERQLVLLDGIGQIVLFLLVASQLQLVLFSEVFDVVVVFAQFSVLNLLRRIH
jgi:hypothetical protein